MFKRDALFEIVQSLSQEEVRNFYRSVNTKTPGDKNYLLLFEMLRKQKRADDKQTLEHFIKKTGIKNFAKTKEYLMDLVFKSLESYPSIENDYYYILDKLYLAEVFFKKGVLHVSEELLNRVKRIVDETEYYDHTDRIFHLMSKLYKKGSLAPEEAGKYLLEYEINSRKAENIRQFRILEVKVHFLARTISMGAAIEKLEEIMKHPLLESEEKAITNSTKIMFHNIYRNYYAAKGNHEKLFEHAKAIVTIYDNYPEFKSHHLYHYLRSLANLGDASLLLNQDHMFKEIKDTFSKHENQLNSSNQSSVLLLYKYHSQFLTYRQQAKYKEGLNLINEFNELLDRKPIKLYDQIEIMQILNLIIFYFANEDFKNFSKLLNRLGELVDNKEFQKHFLLHKVLELVKFYEQKEYDLCDSKIRAIQRYSESYSFSEELRLVFDAIIKVIKEETKAIVNKEKIQDIFNQLNQELWKAKGFSELEDFPFRNWSLAKAEGIKMLELENYFKRVLSHPELKPQYVNV